MATCLATALREHDLLARMGGEEFGVLLPELPMQEAVWWQNGCARLLPIFRSWWARGSSGSRVSIGVASIVGFDEPARVIDAAEKAMFRAKRAGRNRIGGPWVKLAS